jgi:hypothetical protein
MRGEIVKATPANMVVYDMMEREVFEEEKWLNEPRSRK